MELTIELPEVPQVMQEQEPQPETVLTLDSQPGVNDNWLHSSIGERPSVIRTYIDERSGHTVTVYSAARAYGASLDMNTIRRSAQQLRSRVSREILEVQ